MDDINDLDVTKLEVRMQIAGNLYIKSQPIPIKLSELNMMVDQMATDLLLDVAEDYPEE